MLKSCRFELHMRYSISFVLRINNAIKSKIDKQKEFSKKSSFLANFGVKKT